MGNSMVIYHGNCADGFTAAWFMRRCFNGVGGLNKCPSLIVEYVAANYGDEPPDVKGKSVFIVDFSYPRKILMEMQSKAASLVVLDHHKTAKEDLEGLPFCTFDMEQSGAMLAYKYWEPLDEDEDAPILIQYVQDRDLWRFKLPHSKLVNAAIQSYPFTFDNWDKLDGMSLDELVADGKAIQRFKDNCVRSAKDNAKIKSFLGYEVPLVNMPVASLISDTLGELCEDYPFAAGWWAKEDVVVFSLRSKPKGIDVGDLARLYGGGGHKHAAGLTLKMNQELMELLF